MPISDNAAHCTPAKQGRHLKGYQGDFKFFHFESETPNCWAEHSYGECSAQSTALTPQQLFGILRALSKPLSSWDWGFKFEFNLRLMIQKLLRKLLCGHRPAITEPLHTITADIL